jgi:hypothetical protein
MRAVDPDRYIGGKHGPVLLQCGSFDFANVAPCEKLLAAASMPREVRWYDSDHDFIDIESMLDRMQWLERQLGLKPLGREVQRLLQSPRKQATPLKVQ